MKRRRDLESQVAQFFTTAPPDVAVTVFRIVRGILDARGVFNTDAKTTTRRSRRTSPQTGPTEALRPPS